MFFEINTYPAFFLHILIFTLWEMTHNSTTT